MLRLPQRMRDALQLDLSVHTTKVLIAVLAVVICIAISSSVWGLTPSTSVMTVVLTIATALATLYDAKSLVQKLLKLCIVILLVLVQWQAVSKEHTKQAADAQKLAADTQARLSALLDKQNDVIAKQDAALNLEKAANQDRQTQFQQTVNRLDDNITAEKVTIEQTKPRAYLTLRSVELTTSGKVDSLNVHISNLGSSPARKVSLYIHPFYAAHTSVIQRLHGLDDRFEQSWSKIHGGSRDFDHESTFRNYEAVLPGEDIHFSYFLSEPKEPLVDPEFPLSKNIELRLYFRFEYSDPAGNWIDSVCLQNTFTPSKGPNEDADWDGQRRGFKACIDSDLPAGPQQILKLNKYYRKVEGEY